MLASLFILLFYIGTLKGCYYKSMTIAFATSNKHKLAEVRAILFPYGIKVLGLSDLNLNLDGVNENGATYEKNALIKAKALSDKVKIPVVADDSGLEIVSLNYGPGLKSARYAEERGGHAKAMKEILQKIEGKNRSARFVCSIAYIDENKIEHIFHGVSDGHISSFIHGGQGFGYDPIFVPKEYKEKAFSELGDEIKNKISHRARALLNLVDYLKTLDSFQ